MNIRQRSAVYFSPTGNTGQVIRLLAGSRQGAVWELDMTDARRVEPDYSFLENEVVLVGAPVYGGRIPEQAKKRFARLHGHNTPAVAVVTYGNRDYDDALLELKELLEQQGFRVMAAAAVAAEHNIVREIGTGRPDETDRQALARFAEQIATGLSGLRSTYQIGPLSVKGNRPYREYTGIPLKPQAGRRCNQCGKCIRKCPVQAISRTDAKILDGERCISCMRCIAVCPMGARKLNPLMHKAASVALKKKCRERRDAEFFFAADIVR